MSYWDRLISGFGLLLLLGAVGSDLHTVTTDGGLLEAVIDFLLLSFPGVVILYIGTWLPTTSVSQELYPRIVAWTFGGIAVMGLVYGLRVVHPGVDVNFTTGTIEVMVSIGSVGGLVIGVQEAKALTRASALEERNKELKEKRTVERHNRQLRKTERRLEEAVTQLEASNERLEQFAHSLSHDLREPLRMVSRYLQLIDRRYKVELDEEGREFIEFAVDGAERMAEMVQGLLEYSRVETQGNPFGEVDLDAVLDDVLADLQFRIEETDAELTREELPAVGGDERQLRQVFQNLLTNAIEYSGNEPPRVHVSAEREGSEWTIQVRDEGIGIDPDDADRIFGIFQRLHSAEERDGSGIGLALCERIVERHDGEIWVDSEPGEGATFFFTLPAAEDRSSSSSESPRLEGPSP